MSAHGYHHGDLRRTLLAAAAEAISENGPAALSLRELARRAGVSHAAPKHHFGDKAGLLTALAEEGYRLLDEALRRADRDMLEMGIAYVRFAVEHRAHFDVMFQPSLYHCDAPEIVAGRALTRQALDAGLRERSDQPQIRLAAWSIVHGFATLWLSGALPDDLGADPAEAARSVIRPLFEQEVA